MTSTEISVETIERNPLSRRQVAGLPGLSCGRLLVACLFIVFGAVGSFAASRSSAAVQVAAEPAGKPADEPSGDAAGTGATSQQPRSSGRPVAYALDVELPLGDAQAKQLLTQLQAIVQSLDVGRKTRQVVVLRFGAEQDGQGTRFEDALSVARFLSGANARSLRTVAQLRGPVRGHAALMVLACDEFVVAPEASLGEATVDETGVDPAVLAVYESIAAGRGLIPSAAVRAMVDPSLELVRVTKIEGDSQFVTGGELETLRQSGAAWSEERLSEAGSTAEFSASQLRNFRWASQLIEQPGELAEALGVGSIVERSIVGPVELVGRRVDLIGAISQRRLHRLQSNIVAAVDNEAVNTLVVTIDSSGGSFGGSMGLALVLSSREAGIQRSIGYIQREARGDAALMALACRPLLMLPEATIGGPGNDALNGEEMEDFTAALSELAERSGRSEGLLRGLLDSQVEVFRYRHRRTGQVAYFTDDMPQPSADPGWEREQRISLAEGLTASEAVELGLAEGLADSAEVAAMRGGLEGLPAPVSERRIVQFVERLGAMPWLSALLIFIGFMTFSMEASAPGLGVPGFVSLVCFMLFFWIKFLSGTAEWLEVLLFAGGVLCILLELLVIPGTGIFGIGGLVMVVAAIVLTSQTFVLPQNSYQFQQMTGGFLTVLVAFMGIVGGLVGLRYLLPGTPLFHHLVMPGPQSDEMLQQTQREAIVHYDWLMGQEGVALTPLMPAGKARFEDEVIAVVSDGSPIARGDGVRVVEVLGNRVVVHPLQ